MSEEKITKDKRIAIRLTESQKEEIEKFAKDSGLTPADFCRNAIFDKIRQIRDPNLFTSNGLPNNSLRFEEINDLIKVLIKEISELKEVTTIEKSLRKDFSSKLEEDQDLNTNIQLITKAIEQHRKSNSYQVNKTPITLKKIIQETKLDQDLIFDILINFNKFIQKGRGWDLNE